MVKSQFLSTCSADSIQKAAEQLKAGHLVAFPTETVYGLGADAANEEAVKKYPDGFKNFLIFSKQLFKTLFLFN